METFIDYTAKLTDLSNGGDSLEGGADLSDNEGDSRVQVNNAADVEDLAGLEATNGAADGADGVGGNVTDSGNSAGGDVENIAKDAVGLVNDAGDEVGDLRDLRSDICDVDNTSHGGCVYRGGRLVSSRISCKHERTDGTSDWQDVLEEASDEAGEACDINSLALLNWGGEGTEEKGWQSHNGGELHLAGGV